MAGLLAVDRVRDVADPSTRSSGRRRVSWPTVLLLVGAALVALRRAESPYSDGDPLWGARAGLDLLSSGHLPHHDTYSWTAYGQAWVPNSWGWNVVLAVVYRLAGTTGFAILAVVAAMVCAELVRRLARRAGTDPAWTTLTCLAVLALYSTWLYARAQLVDLVAVLGLQLLLPRLFSGDGRTWRRALAIGIGAQVLWMNLHTTAVLAPVAVAGAGVALTVLSRGQRRVLAVRTLANSTALGLACLATPYGVEPIENVNRVRTASVGLIQEWAPAGFTSWLGIVAVVGACLCAVAAVLAIRGGRYAVAGLVVVIGAAAVSTVRFAPLAALSAIPELAAVLSRVRVRARLVSALGGVAAVLLTGAVLLSAGNGFGRPGTTVASTPLVRAIPDGCRLLNDYRVGGAVMLYRPDVKVSIDGRNDMYGRAREIEALRIQYSASFAARFIAQHSVTCVLVPTSYAIVARLQTRGWRVAGRDSTRTLLVAPRS